MSVRLLVFDSGIGGLSVLSEIRRRVPEAGIVYVADDRGFPYGDWDEASLKQHVVGLVGRLIGRFSPDAVVIACNTASTLVLSDLRAAYPLPFVGTVPAVKPAAERTKSGVVAVLATPVTIQRDYTRALIRDFAQFCHVRLVGSYELAPLAERVMRGEDVSDTAIRAEIEPAFITVAGQRTDVVALACTHYPFLLNRLEAVAPWPVTFIDPAAAIARRVVSLLGLDETPSMIAVPGAAHLSSGRSWPTALLPLIESFGLAAESGEAL